MTETVSLARSPVDRPRSIAELAARATRCILYKKTINTLVMRPLTNKCLFLAAASISPPPSPSFLQDHSTVLLFPALGFVYKPMSESERIPIIPNKHFPFLSVVQSNPVGFIVIKIHIDYLFDCSVFLIIVDLSKTICTNRSAVILCFLPCQF